MAASSKYEESYDAEYVDRMVGKVLVNACAAVTLAKPNDPIEFLSLWLHKYCDNVTTMQNYQREKAHQAHKEVRAAEVARKKFIAEEDLRQQQHSAISHMKSITDDPYMLWETCLKAISTFTGCDAAYVAVVINKIFEPKAKERKMDEGEEGDEGEEEEEEPAEEEGEEGEEGKVKDVGSDDSSVDDDQEVEEPDVSGEGEEGEGKEGDVEEEESPAEGEGEEKEGEEGWAPLEEPKPLKPPKPPKPLIYKRKKLLYVATTLPSHIHMLNRQLDIKLAPVTYDFLTEGLPELHIPNVLYKEGIYFLGGVPRVGAYFVVPITVEFIAKKYLQEHYKDRPKEWFDQVRQKQVVAILCCDTLKVEQMGNGRPLEPVEQDFIKACATAMNGVLDENNKNIKKDNNTLVVIEKYKEQLKETKVARKAQLEKERDNAIKTQKAKEKKERQKRFEDAHKAWEERQAIKVEALKRKNDEREAKVKAGEEAPEEEPTEKEEDPEPVPEPESEESEEEIPPNGEEAPVEEATEEGKDEDEEGEEGEKPKDGLGDAELEPDPFQGLDEGKVEGEEGEEGEEGDKEEVAEEVSEEEELEEPEEAEPEAAEGEASPAEGEEEGVPKVEESEDVKKLKEKKANNIKKEKDMKKEIKTLTKLLKGFEKTQVKAIAELDAISKEAEKYEKALFVANSVVLYLKKVQDNVLSLLNENKSRELDRIKRWLYPNRHVQRVLKALLHLLGHKKLVIDDWTSARKLFNQDLLEKVLKHYDPLAVADPDKWKAADSYLAGLKDEKLAEQACIGFLLQQWILGCKKTTAAGVKYHTIKSKFEKISKDFAEKELAKIMCEVETQLAQEKLKKMTVDEEARALKEKTEIELEEKRLADVAAAKATAKEAADKAATDAIEAAAADEDAVKEGVEASAEGA